MSLMNILIKTKRKLCIKNKIIRSMLKLFSHNTLYGNAACSKKKSGRFETSEFQRRTFGKFWSRTHWGWSRIEERGVERRWESGVEKCERFPNSRCSHFAQDGRPSPTLDPRPPVPSSSWSIERFTTLSPLNRVAPICVSVRLVESRVSKLNFGFFGSFVGRRKCRLPLFR